jgi:hypothetical protein
MKELLLTAAKLAAFPINCFASKVEDLLKRARDICGT